VEGIRFPYWAWLFVCPKVAFASFWTQNHTLYLVLHDMYSDNMPREPRIASVAGRGKRRYPHPAKSTNRQDVPQVSMSSTPVMTPSMTPRPATPEESSRGFTTTTFAEYAQKGQISAATYTGITTLTPPHVYTTPVQEQTLGVILSGVDVCVFFLSARPG
jgi:hypothetical protein